MNDRPDDPDIPLAPFPTEIRRSPFPPLDGETAPYLDAPEPAPLETSPSSAEIPGEPASAGPALSDAVSDNPLVTLGRFAFPPAADPDEEGLAARDRRWTSRVIVIAAVFLLIFNIASVKNWARQQAPGWLTTTVSRLAEVWSEQMGLLGADQPREALSDAYRTASEAQWPDPTEPPAEAAGNGT